MSARNVMEETLGPKYWIAKLITVAAVVLLLVLTNFFNLLLPLHVDLRPTYHVTSKFTFASLDKRSLTANPPSTTG